MHSRIVEIKNKKTQLEFGHEGVLYKQSFIMYDLQTDSKWNHSTGLAMAGSLAGKVLEILPSRMVRWKTWREIHPNTKVLAREGRGGFMGSYVADNEAADLGLSVGQGPHAKLYPFTVLAKKPVVNDKVGPHPVTIVMDPASNQVMAFSRILEGRVLSFEPYGAPNRHKGPWMRDQETKSLWHRLSGRAVEGPLRGKEVLPVISVPWLNRRWRQIYTNGVVFTGS